jgi:hypothetical protein
LVSFPRYNDGTSCFRPDHPHYPALCRPLIRAQSLRVSVQRHSRRRVPQQLLHNFHVLSVALEQR